MVDNASTAKTFAFNRAGFVSYWWSLGFLLLADVPFRWALAEAAGLDADLAMTVGVGWHVNGTTGSGMHENPTTAAPARHMVVATKFNHRMTRMVLNEL